MQLRVARLCLDCEELHHENRCPRCASESYAFLTNWLPSEERRRWRRTPRALVAPAAWWAEGPRGVVRALGRWLADEPRKPMFDGPATRAADRAALLNFADADTDGREPSIKVDLPLVKPGVRKA